MNPPYPEDIPPLSGIKNLSINLTLSTDCNPEEKKNKKKTASSSMPLPPNTTPVPQPIFMPGTSPRTEGPALAAATTTTTPSSALPPPRPRDTNNSSDSAPAETNHGGREGQENLYPTFDLPRLRLHIEDIAHDGSAIFLSSVNATTLLRNGIRAVHKHLYTGSPFHPSHKNPHPPPTRSVTLLLRAIDGVAYTTGTDLDPDHKEIHLSLRYVSGLPPSRRAAEIEGVLTHELVHCYQWNGRGTAPGGLVEGVADWVRLRTHLAPPHWRRNEKLAKWDAGYQHTAYFLEYLERRFGHGTVRRLNEKLRADRYEEKTFWTELLGGTVGKLFEDYKKALESGEFET
ncbi:hypothetical protein AAE478_002292 [Parahypoxylon ruwenzoriense]